MKMKYVIQNDGFENHSVWNETTGKKIAENIIFAGCALNMISQLNWGMLKEEDIVCYKSQENT